MKSALAEFLLFIVLLVAILALAWGLADVMHTSMTTAMQSRPMATPDAVDQYIMQQAQACRDSGGTWIAGFTQAGCY